MTVDRIQRQQRRLSRSGIEPQGVLCLHHAGVKPVNASAALDAAIVANCPCGQDFRHHMRDVKFRSAFGLWKFDRPKLHSHCCCPPARWGYAAAQHGTKVNTTATGIQQNYVRHLSVGLRDACRRSCSVSEHTQECIRSSQRASHTLDSDTEFTFLHGQGTDGALTRHIRQAMR